MLADRRGRHEVLPVDQLVPLPIVWEVHVVVVGELHAGISGLHRFVPGHPLILAPQAQRKRCHWRLPAIGA